MLGGLVVIAALSIVLGLLVTHVVETGSIGAADERVNVWLAAHRTPTRTDASLIGSIVAGGVVLPIVVGVAGARVPRSSASGAIAAFVVFALAVESATYRATTLVVHSHRPRVRRLEDLPVNASYPSGHTAASIAVYGGLALLLTSRFRTGAFAIARLGARGRRWSRSSRSRACTAACTTRSTSPAASSSAIAAVIVLVFACRTCRRGRRDASGRTR